MKNTPRKRKRGRYPFKPNTGILKLQAISPNALHYSITADGHNMLASSSPATGSGYHQGVSSSSDIFVGFDLQNSDHEIQLEFSQARLQMSDALSPISLCLWTLSISVVQFLVLFLSSKEASSGGYRPVKLEREGLQVMMFSYWFGKVFPTTRRCWAHHVCACSLLPSGHAAA